MFAALARRVFGSANDRFIKTLDKTVAAVNALEAEVQVLSDQELRARTDWLRGRLTPGQEVRARAYRALNRLTGAGLAAGPTVHPLRLAFRVHMARVMVERLRADATLLAPARAAA